MILQHEHQTGGDHSDEESEVELTLGVDAGPAPDSISDQPGDAHDKDEEEQIERQGQRADLNRLGQRLFPADRRSGRSKLGSHVQASGELHKGVWVDGTGTVKTGPSTGGRHP